VADRSERRRLDERLAALDARALPDAQARRLLALQRNLNESQWWPTAQLSSFSARLLTALLEFAFAHVPHYRDIDRARRAAGQAPIRVDNFGEMPVLTRRTLQRTERRLDAEQLPQGHREIDVRRSSGSTGMPVETHVTDVGNLWQGALNLRAHLWAARDVRKKLAVIRKLERGVASYPNGDAQPAWGSRLLFPVRTGPLFRLSTEASIAEQLEWLSRVRPDYLLTFPSIVRALALLAMKQSNSNDGARLSLAGISTFGETVDDDVRALAQDVFGARIYDTYSAEETGVIALECPSGSAYHVPSEALLVEILDENDRPVAPGEIGRVVVTMLHNYATPLIRYAIGDYAQACEPCACGRGLPTLKRIVGRERNMLIGPTGDAYWPSFDTRRLREVAPIAQMQFRQDARDRVDALFVLDAPATDEQTVALTRHVHALLPSGMRAEVRYVDAIPRSASGKFETCWSSVAP